MDKIIGAVVVLLVVLGLCCGASALGKLGYDQFYTSATATPTPDPVVEQLRKELDKDPEKLAARLESDEAVDAVDMGLGHVDGKGERSIIVVDGNIITNCEEPGKDVPTRCIRLEGTPYWLCNGQILRDCPECPIPTPATAVPPTGVPPTATQVNPPTATAVPPTGVPPTATQVNPPTATAVPPTGVPPTATATPRPIPTNQPTPEGTKVCKCLDVKIDFAFEAKIEPKDWGTTVTKNGNGFMVFLGGVADSFMETNWDDCQYFVGNAYRLDKDWGNPAQGPVTECVVFYHRGTGTIKINVTDGIIFHNDENMTGYHINESLAQMRDTLERGGYGCNRSNIKYVELKTYQ